MDSFVVRMKAKEISSHVIQCQEKLNRPVRAGYLEYFKRQYVMKPYFHGGKTL